MIDMSFGVVYAFTMYLEKFHGIKIPDAADNIQEFISQPSTPTQEKKTIRKTSKNTTATAATATKKNKEVKICTAIKPNGQRCSLNATGDFCHIHRK